MLVVDVDRPVEAEDATCAPAPAGAATEPGPGTGPWQRTDPAEVGLDATALGRAADAVGALGERQGLVVVRSGRIAFERYWENPYHLAVPGWRNVSFSMGKSWGSTIVGRAITLGHLGLDDLVCAHLDPRDSGLHPAATVRDVLTHVSGGTVVTKPSTRPPRRIGDDTPSGPPDEYVRHAAGEQGSPPGYGLGLEPGATFYYDGATTDHLANVVSSATGMTSHEFARREVIGPLGCEGLRYQPEGVDRAGNVRMGGSLLLSVRDAARLGQLYLNEGRWAGEQLLSSDYVAQATTSSALRPGYGLLWWLNADGSVPAAPTSMFFAAGALGQFCFVLPDHDMVIATMGFGRPSLSAQLAWEALREVLPA